ncbi:DUF2218 domain-containing protein [Ruicaihuangia caeni]|uniref:DUF2218 domain-containing protein n=1 Tax=Ruicaihuangia caeni TaxID=3042517 RepID=A0AAW6T8S7_9MICO|nr:DUF2218 domain-containing protein [Klugiella sp. YN-L-19]MDI2098178.1 DUF2218 domain-containing protein [Klugiella sp. YN-L-19]
MIATERPERWSKQLVSHLGRRAAIEETSEGRALALSKGTGIVSTGDGALTLIARGSDEEHTAAVQDILQRHLLRFATREQLTIEWEPIAPID